MDVSRFRVDPNWNLITTSRETQEYRDFSGRQNFRYGKIIDFVWPQYKDEICYWLPLHRYSLKLWWKGGGSTSPFHTLSGRFFAASAWQNEAAVVVLFPLFCPLLTPRSEIPVYWRYSFEIFGSEMNSYVDLRFVVLDLLPDCSYV